MRVGFVKVPAATCLYETMCPYSHMRKSNLGHVNYGLDGRYWDVADATVSLSRLLLCGGIKRQEFNNHKQPFHQACQWILWTWATESADSCTNWARKRNERALSCLTNWWGWTENAPPGWRCTQDATPDARKRKRKQTRKTWRILRGFHAKMNTKWMQRLNVSPTNRSAISRW